MLIFSNKLSFPVILSLKSQKKIKKKKEEEYLTKKAKKNFSWGLLTPGPIEGAQ